MTSMLVRFSLTGDHLASNLEAQKQSQRGVSLRTSNPGTTTSTLKHPNQPRTYEGAINGSPILPKIADGELCENCELVCTPAACLIRDTPRSRKKAVSGRIGEQAVFFFIF